MRGQTGPRVARRWYAACAVPAWQRRTTPAGESDAGVRRVPAGRVQWGKLTDDDLDVIAGRREQLAGKLQERYGIARDEAEKQIDAWSGSARDEWFVKPKDRA